MGGVIDSGAADCHLGHQEGEPPMAEDALKRLSQDVEICTVCNRDPRKPPPGWKPQQKPPRKWAGSERAWTQDRWAARCRVVAKGLCAKDYAAQRRPKSTRAERKGATARETVWIRPETAERLARVCDALKKSKSAWLANLVEAGVEQAEKSINSKSPTGAEA